MSTRKLSRCRSLANRGYSEGSVVYMAPDFDAPLEDFRDYME